MNYQLFKDINQAAGHHPILDGLMVFVTQNALIIYAVVLLLMWFFGKDKYKNTVVLAAITGIIALFINVVIGHIYFEPRPFVSHKVNLLISHSSDASFPSDHGTGAFSLALAVLYRHRKLGIGMVLFAVLTGISRVYVGHHYPFDIIGSLVVAAIVSIFIYKISPIIHPISKRMINLYNRMPLVNKSVPSEKKTKNY
ncbi:undecaprenyl-diphosphatase [Bacillus sp. ISL-18]|uniref:undecaprenyl-diphosphatase n=1 Tax=Bacillus sp. ISL-18 TaxID=2819118 RepID=UPI001BE962A5|nr:undecaprenyl-diphosphatase [Bacillus sp. ISL-18]MBT2656043.1 undecaprenyl-diphosphatase [Bacillus sp. ISL-18]